MIFPQTSLEIQSLMNDEVQESLHLDYKEARAVGKTPHQKTEIAKHVSAFANSDGGVLVYGIKEAGHLPNSITGIDHSQFTREFFEQTIKSNLSSPSPNFTINQIPINKKESVFVIKVEKSYGTPHQWKKDKTFYKRYNFESVVMENYEIDDIRNRRQVAPSLVNVKAVVGPNLVVYLEVSNIGEETAENVIFKIPEELNEWIEERKIKPLKEGIKFLSPKEKRLFWYGISHTVMSENSKYPNQFEIELTYFNPSISQNITEHFQIDLKSYLGSNIEKSDIYTQGEKMEKAIKDLTNEIKKINSNLSSLVNISSNSGLDLSVTTLRNIKHILKDEEFEKIDPTGQNYLVFSEVLGVDRNLASDLEQFFWSGNQLNGLKDVKDITDDIIKKIEKYFILDGEIS